MKRQVRINGFQHSATRHYMYNYGYVPLWILVKVLSFGIVSEMYSILKIEDRIEIAKIFNVSAEDLSIYLPLLSNYRNLCAHEDILYENKTQRMINDTDYHQMLEINQVDSEYVLGKNDIFSLIIILKRVLREDDFKNMMSELENKLKENIQLIDVRTPGEFRRGHIKNAKNIPLNEIGNFTPIADKKIYVICHSGARSKLAAKKLKKRGFDVVNVQGGMHAWRGKIV